MDLTVSLAAPNAADPLSLLLQLGNAPAVSTGSSASPAQDFSALLTELVGPGNVVPHFDAQAVSASTNTAAAAIPPAALDMPSQSQPAKLPALLPLSAPVVNLGQFVTGDPKAKQSQKAVSSQDANQDASGHAAVISVTSVPFVTAVATTSFTASTQTQDKPAEVTGAPNTPDPLSLLLQVGNAPAVSTGSSASPAQDFSTLLTELAGPGNVVPHFDAQAVSASTRTNTNTDTAATPQPALDTASQSQPAKLPALPALPAPVVNLGRFAARDPKAKEPQKAVSTPDASGNNAVISVTSIPFVTVAATTSFAASTQTQDKPAKVDDAATDTLPVVIPPAVSHPELDQALADVKKFEFTVQTQNVNLPLSGTRRQLQDPVAADGKPKVNELPEITTDAITNVQQQQLPLRIIAVQKLAADPKPAERNKPDAAATPADKNTTAATVQMSDLIRPVERAEQPLAAHQVELPDIPHLPVVRTVSMEVGDADSLVTIRIQERGGNITMQLDAGNDALRQDLQSSVGSLAHALKQEQVQVSTIEVSRKSPIDKVRRMKEAT